MCIWTCNMYIYIYTYIYTGFYRISFPPHWPCCQWFDSWPRSCHVSPCWNRLAPRTSPPDSWRHQQTWPWEIPEGNVAEMAVFQIWSAKDLRCEKNVHWIPWNLVSFVTIIERFIEIWATKSSKPPGELFGLMPGTGIDIGRQTQGCIFLGLVLQQNRTDHANIVGYPSLTKTHTSACN